MEAGRLQGLQGIAAALAPARAAQAVAQPAVQEGFGQIVGSLAEEASATQVKAEEQVRALAEGRGDLVDAVLSMNRAELSLSFVVQVRDRALEAYQEIMRLQI